jgi:glycosyltransferase involved in cell wall biosynthesis
VGELVCHGPPRLAARSLRPGQWRGRIFGIHRAHQPGKTARPRHRGRAPLKIAAKVDKVDRDYFESVIDPLLRRPGIEFLGEISDSDKGEFLGNATALLFPIDWPEPFGLAMIEAMANGTPVVAFRCGAVPEVVDDGVTGLVVDSVDAAVAAVPRALEFSRGRIRREFEKRFSAGRMARDYLAVYEGLCAGRVARRHRPHWAEADGLVRAV